MDIPRADRRGMLALVIAVLPVMPACSRPVPDRPDRANEPAVWYLRAGATGDGTSEASPLGSCAAVEAATKPGDVIHLLPADGPLDGGLALKPGQALIGVSRDGQKPSLTNSRSERHDGNGLILANDNLISNVRIVRTQASGVLGVDVSGTRLVDVDVEDANRSAGLASTTAPVIGRISQAGILFIATPSGRPQENQLDQCTVTNAAGIGLGAVASSGAQSRLIVRHARVTGGELVLPLFDMGILALADGPSSEIGLEMSDTVVHGRLSQEGRNVLVFATSDAKATARLDRCALGESGQDGLCAVTARVPAIVNVEIRNSTIERAAQTNIEGSILNSPPFDATRAGDSRISIDVDHSTIRDAGAVPGFRDAAQNIWLGPTFFDKAPFAAGLYHLTVHNSTVRGALQTGIAIGYPGAEFHIAPDEGRYDVRLSDNTIVANGSSDISIAARGARIDARQNCWGRPEGLPDDRIRLQEMAERSQLDVSEPLPADQSAAK